MIKKFVLVILLIEPFFLFAEPQDPQQQKIVEAVRSKESIEVDGLLGESVWQKQACSDFVQSDPIDGSHPSEKTEVWVAFDDNAIYVAAFLHDSQPNLIKGLLGRRDEFLDSDWFIFAVDPYFDHLSGYQFAVNPSGSIVDWTLYNDVYQDLTWDGVWNWKVSTNDKGWAVEIRIPFNQLRFPRKEEYVWGVNFSRFINRKKEKMSLVWVPKEDSGYVSRFAKLEGIKNIHPGRHTQPGLWPS